MSIKEKHFKYPEGFYKLFRKKPTKELRTTKNKTCKMFCKKVYLPEKERVELQYTKRNKMKYHPPTKMIKDMYVNGCNDIYCQTKCPGSKNKWLKSFTQKRKETLIKKGATSGCRDLHKESPEYYKNI